MSEQALHADDRPVPQAQVLIDGSAANCTGDLCLESADQGLQQPEGVAVWHGRDSAVLYVADVAAQKIFAYSIVVSLVPGTLQAGPQQTVASDIGSVTGLAVDGSGNLFYTTNDGQVGRLPAENLSPLNNPVPTILYTSDSQKAVSNPYGLAADSFNLFWTNQVNGQTNGAVIKAFERDPQALAEKYPDYPKIMAKNVPKAAGVCLAKNNVFFTGYLGGQAQLLYGVKAAGGAITEVYKGFQSAAGCAYDGENTLYVADVKAQAIYSLPANFPVFRSVKRVQKAVDADAPGGVAVFTGSSAYSAQPAESGFLGFR